MKVIVKEKEYELKYSFKALLLFEEITGQSFQPKTTKDFLIFFYSIILSVSGLDDYSWEEFINMIDEEPWLINEFSEWITNILVNQNKLIEKHYSGGKNSKKSVKKDEKN